MKEYQQILTELNAKIPREEVSLRDGGSGRKLSYMEGWRIIDLLNNIVGQGNWAYTSTTEKLWEGVVKDSYSKDIFFVSYKAPVKLVVDFGQGNPKTEFTDIGYGDGQDKKNPGKAHELALKEAVTDGLKRCAKNLGHRLGLALYDKTQENVEEEEAVPRPEVKMPDQKPDRDIINKLISQTAKVAVDQKKLTFTQAQEMLDQYGVSTKEALTDVQANELLSALRKVIS